MLEIFLDLDGVIKNFVKQSQVAHNRPNVDEFKWDYFKDWGIGAEDFWRKIDSFPKFWETIEPYPWMGDLIKIVESFDPNYMVLTSPHNHSNCYYGKCAWLQDYLELDVPKRAILTSEKQLLAAPNRILIDDNDLNIEKWKTAGGRGVLFPMPWNSNRDMDFKLAYVCTQLLEML